MSSRFVVCLLFLVLVVEQLDFATGLKDPPEWTECSTRAERLLTSNQYCCLQWLVCHCFEDLCNKPNASKSCDVDTLTNCGNTFVMSCIGFNNETFAKLCGGVSPSEVLQPVSPRSSTALIVGIVVVVIILVVMASVTIGVYCFCCIDSPLENGDNKNGAKRDASTEGVDGGTGNKVKITSAKKSKKSSSNAA